MSDEMKPSRRRPFSALEYPGTADAFPRSPARQGPGDPGGMAAQRVVSNAALHEQLSLIMGALTRAAVAEVCEVVDEGYAVLQLEITRSRQENEDLKKKLHLIESIVVRGSGGGLLGLAVPAAPAENTGQPDDAAEDDTMTGGDVRHVPARELPDVVLIKDEDSDSNDTYEEDAKASADGGPAGAREAASPSEFRSKKRNWPGGSEEGVGQCDRKKPSEQLKVSAGKQKKTPYTLDVTSDDEPGCSACLGDEKDAAESVCSYGSQMDPDVQLVGPECPLAPALSNPNRQAYFGGHGNDAPMESSPSQTGKAEPDLSLTWPKHCKPHMAFAQFTQSESVDSEPFGLKLISVTGSTSTDCHMSEGSNSAFEFDEADMMNFGMYRDQSGRPHCNGQLGVLAKGAKRFFCPICNKTYATSQNLDVHMRIHTGERPFSCGQCGKKFTQSAHLKSHLSVHSGERPYSCALCSKSFIVKYSLKLHMKKCHGQLTVGDIIDE